MVIIVENFGILLKCSSNALAENLYNKALCRGRGRKQELKQEEGVRWGKAGVGIKGGKARQVKSLKIQPASPAIYNVIIQSVLRVTALRTRIN